jgi:multidrug efflux pump
MPLKVNGDAVVRIGDIATLRQTYKDADSYARINGRPAVAIEVSKRTGENIIDTVQKVRAVVEAGNVEELRGAGDLIRNGLPNGGGLLAGVTWAPG